MRNNKDNKLQAFIFFFWGREISGKKLTEDESALSKLLEESALKDLDTHHFNHTKRQILLNIKHQNDTATSGRYFTSAKMAKFLPAAILVLLLSLSGVSVYKKYFQPDVYFAESSGLKVVLKDGSIVNLLKGAELTVEKSFPEDTRLVSLKGDAIFSVAKSKIHPFVVEAENFNTKVLGTVFKISQSGNKKSVDLYEGKVAVSYEGTALSYLKPNQVWTNFGISRTAAIYSKKTDKKSGKQIAVIESLSFNEVPFGEIINVIKEHYKINIIYPNEIASKKISAELKGSVDDNIDILAFAVGLEVEKHNTNTYTLKK
ncbi:FecR family protein [Chryseobacterium sp. 2TAF14]|uniref:FecR family protein n=1 Tax=Chryseobacterium sp. 2TAF14 TaxID=3233007 RepID=UPI003F938FF5